MSAITAQHVRAAAKGKVNESNLTSVLVALDRYGDRFGMDRPHRLAQYFAQLMHESGDFRYDREIWGPTPAQQRYDTRADLGNTPEKDGDGYLYRGRTGMQLWQGHYRQFPTGALPLASTARTSSKIRMQSIPILGKAWFPCSIGTHAT